MRTELPVVSFLCAVALASLAPAHWAFRNVATLSLLGWLFICNVIQGVNSTVWATNSVVKIPVWCDIASKLLLGVRIALPAACLCICIHLWRCLFGSNMKNERRVLFFDYILCIILPVVYMAFHILVQDYRFDLAEGFGCTPSAYPSAPALILVWLPPLLVSITALIFACVTMGCHHLSRARTFTGVLKNHCSALDNLSFFCSTAIIVLISSFTLASTAFTIHVHRHLLPWTSWARVHVHLSEANVIASDASLTLLDVELAWWVVPASSLVLVATSIIGLVWGSRECSLDGYRTLLRHFRVTILRQKTSRDSSDSFTGLRNHMDFRSSDTVTSVHLSKSGWADTARSKSLAPLKPSPISIVIPSAVPVSPPASTASEDSDTTFALSTLTYLDSPAGKEALGLPGISERTTKLAPLQVELRALSTSGAGPVKTRQDVCQSPPPRPHSILSEPWPRPPSAIPVSPVAPITIHPPSPGPAYPPSRPPSTASFSTSLASSTVSTSAYEKDPSQDNALHDSPTLPEFAPFADASIPAQQTHGRGMSLAVPRRTRKMRSKDVLVTRNLSLSLRPRERIREEEGADAIYMTVVKETV